MTGPPPNPPLFPYPPLSRPLYETIPYELASGGDVFDRLYVMRLFSGLLMLVTAVAGGLAGGELTRGAPLLPLSGASGVRRAHVWNPVTGKTRIPSSA